MTGTPLFLHVMSIDDVLSHSEYMDVVILCPCVMSHLYHRWLRMLAVQILLPGKVLPGNNLVFPRITLFMCDYASCRYVVYVCVLKSFD